MVKIGFSLESQLPCPQAQFITLLHDAGFSAISPVWADDLQLEALADTVAKCNMTIQSLHAPRRGIPQLWDSKDPLSDETANSITDCIDACAEFDIPIVVMHGWQGQQYVFPDTPLDFSVFDRIVDYAEKKQVAIAFENLEGEEYLQALLERYWDQTHIGFCWDSGHDQCYPHKIDFLESFGTKLMMTHINDNFGLRDPGGIPGKKDDLHFLPFDGNIHWESAMGRLKSLPKQDILNFEIKKQTTSPSPEDLIYKDLSAEEFIHLAGQRAKEIAKLYENTKQA